MAKKKSKKISNGMFAFACILLAIIVMAIIFLAKKDQILSNYKETGFFERIFGKTPEFVENHENKTKDTITLKEDDSVVINIDESQNDEIEKSEISETSKIPSVKQMIQDETSKVADAIQEKVESNISEKAKEITQNAQETIKESVSKATNVAETAKNQTKTQTPNYDYQLCFVNIDSDGSVVRKIVKRTDKKSDSPLTTAINLLIKGPIKTSSAEKDCINLIPEGTKLLSARVSDSVAYLNFNENFEFNSVGVEGIRGQLMQIVYTATSFSTVNSVQFLIEGSKQDYLGSEGQWIGSPLSRSNF